MKPFFKWAGGKRRELKIIRQYMPSNFDSYHEPFVGGGALLLDLEPGIKRNIMATINDNASDLVNFFEVMKEGSSKLISELNRISFQYNERYQNVVYPAILSNPKGTKIPEFEHWAVDSYYKYRDNIPETRNKFDNAIRFYVLNQLSFGGFRRFNRAGKFNVPFSGASRMKKLDADHETLRKISMIMDKTEVRHGDWSHAVSTVDKNSFVFLDPPYTTTFRKYNGNSVFEEQDHERLADWFKNTSAKAMVVINKDDFTSSLYSDNVIFDYDHRYSIKIKGRISKQDSETKHMLCINY